MNSSAPAMTGQMMVDQRPVFENALRKRKKRGYSSNQVIGKGGIIRPDKRMSKPKFL